MNARILAMLLHRLIFVLCVAGAGTGCTLTAEDQRSKNAQPALFTTAEQTISSASQLSDWQPLLLTISKKRKISDWISIAGQVEKQVNDKYITSDKTPSPTLFVALVFQHSKSSFSLMELSVGDTDAEFVEWIDEYSLPADLFFDKPPSDTQWGSGD